MIPYGSTKRTGKRHPHNECLVCGERIISPARERFEAKEQIRREIEELEDDHG